MDEVEKGHRQLTVDLKDLERNAGSAVEYFWSELDGSVKVRGTLVRLQIERARDANQILHKFVRRARFAGYREAVVHPRLVELRLHRKRSGECGSVKWLDFEADPVIAEHAPQCIADLAHRTVGTDRSQNIIDEVLLLPGRAG